MESIQSTSIATQIFTNLIVLFTVMALTTGLIMNCGAITVFIEVPKLLKSTVNTFVRNLFLLHIITTLVLGIFVISEWISWNYERIEAQSFGSEDHHSSLCVGLTFTRASFVSATFGIIWLMTVDRTMTVIYPRSPHTILLKRHPSLASVTLCACAFVWRSYYLVISPEPTSSLSQNCVHQFENEIWRTSSFAVYTAHVVLLAGLCCVLMVRVHSPGPAKTSRAMKKVVFLVVLLTFSYIMCTALQKITELIRVPELVQRIGESLVLLPILIHPLIFYLMSENFRKALRRCLHRRRNLRHRRNWRQASNGFRSNDSRETDYTAAGMVTEMTTAFSITSEESPADTETKNDQSNVK